MGISIEMYTKDVFGNLYIYTYINLSVRGEAWYKVFTQHLFINETLAFEGVCV